MGPGQGTAEPMRSDRDLLGTVWDWGALGQGELICIRRPLGEMLHRTSRCRGSCSGSPLCPCLRNRGHLSPRYVFHLPAALHGPTLCSCHFKHCFWVLLEPGSQPRCLHTLCTRSGKPLLHG